jgi:AraC family transcriptional regulator
MNVEIVERPEMRVAGVRHVGPYHQLHAAFERLGTIAGSSGLFARPGVAVLGVYHDTLSDVPEDELRSDAAVTLPDDAPCPDGLAEQRIPGGRYATAIHEGSYARLADTWAAVMRTIAGDGHATRQSPCFEIYRNQPGQVPDEELRTELFVPVQ